MPCYLVTGGAGFIGSHLVDALLARGHAVRILDDLSNACGADVPREVEFIQADVADTAAVRRAFLDIDGCFHLAAIASVERGNNEWLRTHQVNLTGTINVFNEARQSRRHGGVPVVYASTAAVYGSSAALPASETCSAAPISAYGADKRACELHARAAGGTHGLQSVGLRFFNVYGPRQNPRSPYSGVIAIFLERLRRGQPIDIFGDGEQVRDFVYVEDAVCALQRAMPAASPRASTFNICTGKGTTVRRLAETIAGLCRAELVISHRPARCGEVPISIGDPRCAVSELGFRAGTPLSDGLAATLDALAPVRAATLA